MSRGMAHLLTALFVVAAVGYPSRRSATDLDATPRTTVTFDELSGVRRFGARTLNYSTLLLEDDRGILYVGARGAIFALNSSDVTDGSHRTIHWEASPEKQMDCLQKGKNNKTECFNHVRFLQRLNSTHLYACGTYAFHPLCAAIDADMFTLPSHFEEGKEKCPYDPARGYTGLIVDGGLYTATRYEFRSLPDIRRNLHQRPLKTEESPLHWLNDAEFVASVLVRESKDSPVGDDDKIYYFFTERAGEETTSFFDKSQVARVARVARVCKSDVGGKKILQRKWTSFMKARLVCYIPYYEVLRSICSLDGGGWASTVFYAAFTLSAQWRTMEASAVCRYSISAVQRAFEGPYMEYQDSARKWSRYDGVVPEPRPGSCITDRSRRKGYNSSQDLPNSVLDFVKLHPLMFEEVKPTGGEPLLVKKSVAYSRLAVDRVRALDGHSYDVLFMGTGDGWIHKAVVVGSGLHIVEEVQVFRDPQPVESLVISHAQRSLYVGAASGILQVPLASCARYASCYDCILARDPYCAWDSRACRAIATADSTGLVQDIQGGNEGCRSGSGRGESSPPLGTPGGDASIPLGGQDGCEARVPAGSLLWKNRTVLQGDDVLLPCDQRSNLARAVWLLNGSEVPGAGQDRLRVGVDGLLVTDTLPRHSGEYRCYGEERGLRTLLAAYSLTVLPELPRGPTAASRPHAASQAAGDVKVAYVSAIVALVVLCAVLSTVLLYVSCLEKRKGKYVLGEPRPAGVELQTVSANCLRKSRREEEEEEEELAYPDGCLQIIPGEAPTAATSPVKELPAAAPPLPPPPPLPAELTNGVGALPNVLRKMNGNSYMLLQQQEEPLASPLYSASFTEELSKILEKRKHTQLVEKLDESSV
ncbi:semaphorin-4G isoform X2 [Tyto alba]|uniref:semaphorin-4G isoform X2 n=1 Tax=Tyto alba TaxID=56313 RepID=UPI001C684D9B|nr:semaphorin-4G isoform X2 [Tyto alba]XP_042645042.1 semaphorin-4G isoform X2 [Tyto alba]XP_042645047.1 semaphorin-4G isoform X2 [Tyto alba]XP_042645052.1 semaphorin-4G isoform X2 [Tyto alba]XP_042645057.1 semaphorin-4G isoform X2 [Tyto alba]XP_042645064.1 semaphorin-4G isoform X2 [Tyto alba]XP_042645070.1 semaphorin-4G isoform X2 [Tyto alba]XP_042645076.1 semaphorin-4G isoform X2 [Tyto alba]